MIGMSQLRFLAAPALALGLSASLAQASDLALNMVAPLANDDVDHTYTAGSPASIEDFASLTYQPEIDLTGATSFTANLTAASGQRINVGTVAGGDFTLFLSISYDGDASDLGNLTLDSVVFNGLVGAEPTMTQNLSFASDAGLSLGVEFDSISSSFSFSSLLLNVFFDGASTQALTFSQGQLIYDGSFNGGDPGQLITVVVPEPSSVALLFAGLAGTLVFARRRKAA